MTFRWLVPCVGVKNPGSPQEYSPICFIAWRHQFQHVPYFIIPERHGTIAGNVFRDDQSTGIFGDRACRRCPKCRSCWTIAGAR